MFYFLFILLTEDASLTIFFYLSYSSPHTYLSPHITHIKKYFFHPTPKHLRAREQRGPKEGAAPRGADTGQPPPIHRIELETATRTHPPPPRTHARRATGHGPPDEQNRSPIETTQQLALPVLLPLRFSKAAIDDREKKEREVVVGDRGTLDGTPPHTIRWGKKRGKPATRRGCRRCKCACIEREKGDRLVALAGAAGPARASRAAGSRCRGPACAVLPPAHSSDSAGPTQRRPFRSDGAHFLLTASATTTPPWQARPLSALEGKRREAFAVIRAAHAT